MMCSPEVWHSSFHIKKKWWLKPNTPSRWRSNSIQKISPDLMTDSSCQSKYNIRQVWDFYILNMKSIQWIFKLSGVICKDKVFFKTIRPPSKGAKWMVALKTFSSFDTRHGYQPWLGKSSTFHHYILFQFRFIKYLHWYFQPKREEFTKIASMTFNPHFQPRALVSVKK